MNKILINLALGTTTVIASLGAISFLTPQAKAASIYADWTLDSSAISGTGTFNALAGMPDFSFSLSGSDRTQIDDNDVFDYAPWENLFGEGDNQESLRFGSPGNDGSSPSNPLLTTSTLTINFDSAVNPSGQWGFAVTDLEGEDAVIAASLGGNPIPNATVASWFQDLFDSKPNDPETNPFINLTSPHLPSSFDSLNTAVVAETDADGLLSDEILANTFALSQCNSGCGTESASAWFVPDTPFDTLTITHRNRFGGGASMHVYLAAASTTSVPEPAPVATIIGLGLLILSSARKKDVLDS